MDIRSNYKLSERLDPTTGKWEKQKYAYPWQKAHFHLLAVDLIYATMFILASFESPVYPSDSVFYLDNFRNIHFSLLVWTFVHSLYCPAWCTHLAPKQYITHHKKYLLILFDPGQCCETLTLAVCCWILDSTLWNCSDGPPLSSLHHLALPPPLSLCVQWGPNRRPVFVSPLVFPDCATRQIPVGSNLAVRQPPN